MSSLTSKRSGVRDRRKGMVVVEPESNELRPMMMVEPAKSALSMSVPSVEAGNSTYLIAATTNGYEQRQNRSNLLSITDKISKVDNMKGEVLHY